jgi:multidrug transporter EmrE-like cation transporter
MNLVTWLLILGGVTLNAVAQLTLKRATGSLSAYTRFDLDTLLGSVAVLVQSPPFWVGMGCYGLSVCVWIAALSRAPVSVAYPMLSIGYVIVAVASVMWLGETLSLQKVLGIVLICGGVYLVSRSSA